VITTDRWAAEPIRQLGTHRQLVSRTEQRKIDTRLTLDAIVVPASRQARNLDPAITLARAARSALVILCSHQAAPDEVRQLIAERSFDRAVVIGLPDNYGHELLEFRALASIKSELPAACSYYATNLSTKRNLGLLLARMVGWERIFFLDDDIRDIGHPDLQSTVSMLARYRTAGMRVTRFPDNSAACHAHRETGGSQDVFLSGSALAVDMQKNVGFFPDIYNEDWLFFYEDAASGQLGSSGRKITQLVYEPFADPQRAAWQEFGDVLAEGLYALLDRGLGLGHATREYWSDFLHARHSFLKAILRRADTAKWEIRDQLLLSVKAALECSVTLEPRVLERYIWLWRRDLDDWQQRVAEVGQMYALKLALKELGLEPSVYGRAVDVARPRPEVVSGGPPTVPYELSDLYELLDRRAIKDGYAAPDPQERGAGTKRASFLLHRGSLGVRQSGLVAMTRRGFRKPGRAYGQQEPSGPPEAAG
jgi:hypothetical protein